jgi:tetratricopeptide (TPR) repeat protein
MKKYLFINAALLAVFFSLPFGYNTHDSKTNVLADINALKVRSAIYCTPDRAQLLALLDDQDIPLLPGSGTYVWKINTTSDSAQIYFNQGINTYYGFHIIESLASFKKAAKFDPDNPMVWWAQALAYGPNINDMGYSVAPDALIATKKALALIGKATPVEQALISAMEARYSDDSTKERHALDQAYTDAMKQAAEKFQDIVDVQVLYADAMMLQHPWDLWNVNGTPKPWEPSIQEVLEKTLAKAPMHPGANHYYIHIIEPSPHPEKALASADILGKLTPGLAHLVHMPSHIYLRTGQYIKGTEINADAVSKFQQYTGLFPAVTNGGFLYYLHNEHMLVNCAMLAGKYGSAIKNAMELQQSIDSATMASPPPLASLVHYVYMAPMLINVRFEKWDSLIKMSKPDSAFVYANVLYHFGRGMAFAGKNDVNEAKEESQSMKGLMRNPVLIIPMQPFSAAIDGAKTANEILDGFIALKENKNEEAIAHFTTAVKTEQAMVYDEPRDWFLNPNQYLGCAYLKNNDTKRAIDAFNKDLSRNAKNVWSLYGLRKAMEKKSNNKAAAVKTEFDKAAEQADIDFASLDF